MNDTDGPSYRSHAAVRPAAVVIVALIAACSFGAIDQYLAAGTTNMFLIQVSGGMSAVWLLVPFLAGAWQADQRRAALVGLAASWLSVLGYIAMIVSPVEGTHLTPRLLLMVLASQSQWFATGLITGPLYGWLGYRWRSGRSRTALLLAVLPVLLEPVARWLATRFGLGNIPYLPFQWPGDGRAVAAEFAELAVGLLLTVAAVMAMARPRVPGKV